MLILISLLKLKNLSQKKVAEIKENSFLSHLFELRDRLIRIVITILIIFVALFSFSNQIYLIVAEPLHSILPKGQTMIATGVISPFLTPFKLTLVVSFYIAIPMVLYQVWAFVAPGLYKNEKRFMLPLAVSSTLLFYLGMVFAYFVVLPIVFPFLAGTTPDGIAYTPDIKEYLDFVLKMFFAFGVAFEVPIATFLLVKTGMTTAESLSQKRPFLIVGSFIVGMLLTPPDIISQTLLALPMWILFEIGLLFAKRIKVDDDYYTEMSDEEMESELDQIEQDEKS